jgi:hypothetical protein
MRQKLFGKGGFSGPITAGDDQGTRSSHGVVDHVTCQRTIKADCLRLVGLKRASTPAIISPRWRSISSSVSNSSRRALAGDFPAGGAAWWL